MSSYLKLAYTVLKASRRPMTSAGILEAAYAAQMVPKHLYGKTQAKTLQARLSEDVLRNKVSAFFRTDPGYFFLNELINDPAIPVKFKERFEARRRTRDLHVAPFLAVDRDFVQSCDESALSDWHSFVSLAEAANAIFYVQSRNSHEALVVWTFSMVRRGSEVLTYRTGRYRTDRDSFANKRTVGFPGVIGFFDCTLFSSGDYGAKENALSAIASDLDISVGAIVEEQLLDPRPLFTLRVSQNTDQEALMIVMDWNCPPWFEPTTRRLSLNDPQWLNLDVQPNNLGDFEPWTKAALAKMFNEGKLD